MKRKIRVAGVLAIAAGTALLATACSGSGGNTTRSSDEQGHDDLLARTRRPVPGRRSGRDAVADFEKANPNVTIKIQTIQNEDLDGKLQTALNSGDAPDIFLQRGGGKMAAMVNAGQLHGHHRLGRRRHEDRRQRRRVQGGVVQGKVYAMPHRRAARGHLLQQGPLQGAGITAPPDDDRRARTPPSPSSRPPASHRSRSAPRTPGPPRTGTTASRCASAAESTLDKDGVDAQVRRPVLAQGRRRPEGVRRDQARSTRASSPPPPSRARAARPVSSPTTRRRWSSWAPGTRE